jgi:alpha-tubulin suppressor-like RCC1 family protein
MALVGRPIAAVELIGGPVQIPGLTGISSVAADQLHSVALTSDHHVLAWGHNVVGEVGDGSTTDQNSPVQVPGLTTVQQISAGNLFTLAIAT